MKNRTVLMILACTVLALSFTGCGKSDERVKAVDDDAREIEETVEEKTEAKPEKKKVTINSEKSQEKIAEETSDNTDSELFEAFLKNNAEVHFTNYQPEKYYGLNDYFFDKNDSVTLNDLLSAYYMYYLEELSYSQIYRNVGYTYIDAGDAGREQLVVECDFPQGTGAQFIIEVRDGQLEMMYVIDSLERLYGTVANKYGLITRTGTSSYAQYDVENKYLDENGTLHNIYTESANYLFGQETGYADPLLDWAADFREKEGFKDDAVLRTYSFDEFEADFSDEEEKAYYDNMMYTVEYVTDEEPWHEDAMYEKGSVFSRIFEKAGRKLSTPEEIEEAIKQKKKELKMPEKAMEEDPVILTDLTDKEAGAIFGADVSDGRSELEHAITAYEKFLKDPVNMCDILTEQTKSPYGNSEPGMVYGFALRDFTEDGIPELVIDFGQPAYPTMQKIYIYSYYESDGMVRQMFKMPEGAVGDYGIKYLKSTMNESYLMQYNEEFEKKGVTVPGLC